MLLSFIIVMVFAATMLVASYKDATTMKIPNWVSLVLLGVFFLITPFVWQSWEVFGTHLLVGLTFFAAGFAMFAFGWLGGGDAKLMAATAIWWQWPDALIYIFYTTAIGGVLALFIMVGRNYVPVRIMTAPWVYHLLKEEKNMPYGLALAAGALITLPQSQLFLNSIG